MTFTRRVIKLFGLCLLFLLSGAVLRTSAARSLTVDQSLIIRLEQNQPTSVVYPESILKVIVGWSEKDLWADHVGPYLYLISYQPELNGQLFVVGESGRQYPGFFKTATPPDTVVFVTLPTPQTAKAVPLSANSLLRRLRSPEDKSLPGERPATIATPMLPDPRFEVVSATSVQVGEWYGMTLVLRNTQETSLVLDVRLGLSLPVVDDVVSLQSFVWPPLFTPRRVTAVPEQVAPGAQARVYLVFERKESQHVR